MFHGEIYSNTVRFHGWDQRNSFACVQHAKRTSYKLSARNGLLNGAYAQCIWGPEVVDWARKIQRNQVKWVSKDASIGKSSRSKGILDINPRTTPPMSPWKITLLGRKFVFYYLLTTVDKYLAVAPSHHAFPRHLITSGTSKLLFELNTIVAIGQYGN